MVRSAVRALVCGRSTAQLREIALDAARVRAEIALADA
jgi:hypothetical protein